MPVVCLLIKKKDYFGEVERISDQFGPVCIVCKFDDGGFTVA